MFPVREFWKGIGMTAASALERVLKRDRLLVSVGIVGVTALAWAYLFLLAADMGKMDVSGAMGSGMAMAQAKPWSLLDFALMFIMWAVMMVAMMLPSASPMILLYATVARKQQEEGKPFVPVGLFASGYLMAWTAFSLVAAGSQWALEQVALLSPAMVSASPYLGGALLVGAGVYQLTPLKNACLKQCRSPQSFVAHHWRTGTRGTLLMGMQHGAFCVGCCWALMALLFVGGVMNLLWVAIIAGFVLLEKVLPAGHAMGRLTGVALVAWGIWLILS
jgi:predicted metal-binding membrane protein